LRREVSSGTAIRCSRGGKYGIRRTWGNKRRGRKSSQVTRNFPREEIETYPVLREKSQKIDEGDNLPVESRRKNFESNPEEGPDGKTDTGKPLTQPELTQQREKQTTNRRRGGGIKV